jgi:hypothetical protein
MTMENAIAILGFSTMLMAFVWWMTSKPPAPSLPAQIVHPQPPATQGFNFNGVAPLNQGLAQLVARLEVGQAVQARDHLGQGIMISVIAHDFGSKIISQRDQFGQEQRYRVSGNNVVEHIQ